MPAAHPILTCEEARELERQLFQGDEAREWEAILAAGRAVAAAIQRDWLEIGPWPRAPRLLLLVGKGHNGADALVAGRELLEATPSAQLDVVLTAPVRELRPQCERAWRALAHVGGERVRLRAEPAERYDVVIDGVFGFNYRPPLPPEIAELLARTNALAARLRVAIDVPSGIGECDGFRADFTYATGSLKDVVVAPGALGWTGRVRYLDLGFFKAKAETGPAVLVPRCLDALRALRPAATDKRDFGHVLVLAGSALYPGAALMSVRAALAAGAGLVTAFVPEPLVPSFAAAVPEAIWVGWPVTPDGGLALEGLHLARGMAPRGTAWLMGPGIGREPETLALVAELVRTTDLPVVLDADALQPDIVALGRCPRVVTPHAGEWARIRDGHAASDFCILHNATVVEKGPLTWVHGRRGAFFSPAGGPVLARGGSGDLLSGMVAARVAVHRRASLPAVSEAVLWHGLAADALARAYGQVSVRTTDLLGFLPRVLREEIHG
ncbi:NAD(P)H-hydrate dehydratase [Nibricoccus sp. IMCC34717]|uniref:NAD(P)H-hydrate dehydratase n=1 Tax=Nibricoccus sp. IMCC34717 TaxID=3034021 RepID=UPI00384CDA44